jgi:hypothetical protein
MNRERLAPIQRVPPATRKYSSLKRVNLYLKLVISELQTKAQSREQQFTKKIKKRT